MGGTAVVKPSHCRNCPWFALCGGPTPTCAYCQCEGVRDCVACGVRCAHRRDEPDWLADVGGTLELDLPWTPMPLPTLPRFIPVIHSMARMPELAAYTVRWDKVLSAKGNAIQKRWLAGNPQAALGVRADAPVLASLWGPDPPIESFWHHQFRSRLLDQLATCRFALVLAPNYSVYGDQPRYEHLLNQKRSLLIAERMRRRGIVAVPNFYPWRREDAVRLGEWARTVGLDVIGHNCQTYRADREWNAALHRLVWLREELPDTVRWFFMGVSSKERIRTIRQLFPTAHILAMEPYQAAAHGVRMLPDGRRVKFPAQLPELLVENVRVMQEWIEG